MGLADTIHASLLVRSVVAGPDGRCELPSGHFCWTLGDGHSEPLCRTLHTCRVLHKTALSDPPPEPRRGTDMDDRAEEVQRVLEAIDALTEGEPPEARARRLTELLKSVSEKVRRERREAVMEMVARGMTYRQIADVAGVSFGRVRQIIADDPDATPSAE